MRRSGFTVLELLVASLLLAMLVTVLTMIFNQSSIAWRTGVAGVVELDRVRARLGTYHDIEDDVLPGLGQTSSQIGTGGSSDNRELKYRTVSIFKGWSGTGKLQQGASRDDGNCSGRLYDGVQWSGPSSVMKDQFTVQNARKGTADENVGSGESPGGGAYVVGVRSAGPDKKWSTADDISTFPEEVE